MKIDAVIEPYNDAQLKFLESDAKVTAYVGGVGSGKTHLGAAKLLMQRFEYPNADLVCGANSYKQLESATLPKVFNLLDEWGLIKDKHWVYNKKENTIKFKLPGFEAGTIYCRSMDNYETIRGMEVLYIWLDEAADTPIKAFEICLARMRQKIVTRSGAINYADAKGSMKRWEFQKGDVVPSYIPVEVVKQLPLVMQKMAITTTPDMVKAKWLYDYLHNPERKAELEEQGIKIVEINCDSRDNPYLPEHYLETMAQSYDEDFVKQEIMGQWVIIQPGKPVYGRSFNADTHLGSFQYRSSKELFLFWDFGFHHPAMLAAQEDDAGRIIILGELMGHDVELEEFCDEVKNYLIKTVIKGPFRDINVTSFVDPAGNQKSDKGRTSVQVLRQCGFQVVRYKKIKFIKDGVACVRAQLNKLVAGRPALMIDRNRCPILIEGMRGGYHYSEEIMFKENKEEPQKDNWYEHIMDALRYGITNLRFVALSSKKYETVSNWKPISKKMGY